MGERVPSHPCLCQERRVRDTYSEMPHKQGFFDAYEIFFNGGIEGQDGKTQIAATMTDTKNIKLTK